MSDMQSEKDYFCQYNVFVHNHDFEKVFQKIDDALVEYEVLYEKDYYKFLFSETLTNTCEHKIKSFTIEQKHFNKIILYKWSIVQLVIYNINKIIIITMN